MNEKLKADVKKILEKIKKQEETISLANTEPIDSSKPTEELNINEAIETENQKKPLKERIKETFSSSSDSDKETFIEDIKPTDLKERMTERVEKTKESIEEVKSKDNIAEKIGKGLSVGYNSLRVVTGALTTPIIFSLNGIGKLLPKLGKVIVQPLQVPSFLLSKMFSTKSKYNGKYIGDFGERLGTIVGDLSLVTSKGISIL